jgi:hypothetical protein
MPRHTERKLRDAECRQFVPPGGISGEAHSLEVCEVTDHQLQLGVLGTMLIPDGIDHTAGSRGRGGGGGEGKEGDTHKICAS